MKLGILGTGMIVKDMLRMVDQLDLEEMSILGTLTTQQETEALAKQYGIKKIYYDYQEMLASDIDTLYIALPNHLHFKFAYEGLQMDKHVIIEKPITANGSELKTLIELAKVKNKMILEAMNIHYLPAYLSLKEEIKELGALKIVTLNYSQYSSRYNAFKAGNILPAFDYHKAGGALMDLNVYNLHCIVGLFGKPMNVHYFANVENKIDTSGILLLDYGTFKVSCIGAKDCKAPIISSFQGDKGCIIAKMPVNQLREYQLIFNDGISENKCFEKDVHRLYYEFKEFIRIIKEKDIHKASKMLQISLTVSEIMEEARKQMNIVFDNDNQRRKNNGI